jgi:predicted DNA-binding protein (UPF0251 family)
MPNDDKINALLIRLDTIIKLMMVNIVQGKDQTEAIRLLSSTGLQPKDIAQITGVPRTTVNARLSEIRRKEAK